MHAVFVTNQLKTGFYEVLASRMRREGVAVSWISVSERWTRFLIDRGWPEADILSLPRFGAEWSGPLQLTGDDRARLARIEATAEAGLKNILIMDRELSRRPSSETEGYVTVVTREIERFVLAQGITHGFGEPTWAPEMLTSEVLRAHGRGYYMHHTIRIPSNRIGFYEGIFHDTLVSFARPSEADRAVAKDSIAAITERGERPYYFARNMNPQKFRRHWLGEAALAITRGGDARYDHSVPSLITRSRRRLMARRRAAQVRGSDLFEQPSPSQRPYLFVLLHKQPEASVDVFGNAFSNQFETIKALARVLPFDWEIRVKEHGHAIGDHPIEYYEGLRAIPGVSLIAPGANSFTLMAGAGLTASVASTGCMEAGVLGFPAITFARVFYAPLLVADGVDPYGLTLTSMAQLLERAAAFPSNPDRAQRAEDFITQCIAQSCEGMVADPVSDPSCVESGNIDRIAGATIAMMQATLAQGSLQKPVGAIRPTQ